MGGSRRRALVVLHDVEQLQAIREQLGAAGFVVDGRTDGASGLERLAEAPPDILVLEWLLPEQDGIEVLVSARKRPSGASVPVVMIEAEHPFRDLETEAMGLSISATIRAPFEPVDLLALVKEVLGLAPEPETAEASPAPPAEAASAEDARASEPLGTPLRGGGSLAEVGVAELLHLARADRLTGALTFRSADGERRVYLRDGRPVAVTSTRPDESLARHLEGRGRLGADGLMALEAEPSGREVAQTAELLKRGLLAPHELHEALRALRTEILVALFALEEGEHGFAPGRDWEPDIVPVQLDTPRIVLDGVAQHYDEERLGEVLDLPDDAWVYLAEDAPYAEGQLRLSTSEARVFDMARHGVRLGDAVSRGHGSRLEVARLLVGLATLGMVRFQVGGVPPQVRPTPEPRVGRRRPAKKRKSPEEVVAEEHERLAAADFFEVLGVDRDAPLAEVHRAFREREPRYRPESLAELPDEAREMGEELHLRLVEAYRVLTDPKRRIEYVDDLAEGETERWEEAVQKKVTRFREEVAERAEAARIARARHAEERAARAKEPRQEGPASGEIVAAVKAAQEAIEAGHPRAAIRGLRDVLNQAPEEPLPKAWLGWALFSHNPDKYGNEAAALLESAVETGSPRHEPYLFLARVSDHLGAYDTAAEMYEAAKERSGDDMEIKREAHLFEVRAKKRPKRKAPRPTPRPRPSSPPSSKRKSPTPSPTGAGDSAWTTDLGTLMKGIFKKKP